MAQGERLETASLLPRHGSRKWLQGSRTRMHELGASAQVPFLQQRLKHMEPRRKIRDVFRVPGWRNEGRLAPQEIQEE